MHEGKAETSVKLNFLRLMIMWMINLCFVTNLCNSFRGVKGRSLWCPYEHMRCNWVDNYQHFGRTDCLQLL
jgi:hypothetical protein